MITLHDKQTLEIIECETRSQALAYVSKYDFCVWEMNGDDWEIRPRKEMFKGMHCMQGGY
jgi:hypothetical protein